jgi:hypothetical protein
VFAGIKQINLLSSRRIRTSRVNPLEGVAASTSQSQV